MNIPIRKSKFIFVSLAIVAIWASCTHEIQIQQIDLRLRSLIEERAQTGESNYFIMPEAKDYASLPNQDPLNPITKEKADLGKLLFFETGLAQDAITDRAFETYSCATCHIPERGFLPGRIQGIADGAFGYSGSTNFRPLISSYEETELDAQGIRPLTVMNVTFMTNTLWSGTFGANDRNEGTEEHWTGIAEINHEGFHGIEAQNIEGLHLHRMAINDKVLYEFGYAPLFDSAFPEIPIDERYSTTTASFALSAYLRTLLTNQAPFQDYLKGDDDALTESEKNGALLFLNKAQCFSCHNGPSFSAMNFKTIGAKDLYESGGVNTSADEPRNLGRAFFTQNQEDENRFKVPQLYNLKDYATYFHGSSKGSIEEVVDYKILAKSENANVTDSQVQLNPLSLTSEEKQDLINFLTNALYDPNMERYVPESVLSGYCIPNNDPTSRAQLGCD